MQPRFILIAFILSGVLFAPFSFAQEGAQDDISNIDRREELKKELNKIQGEIEPLKADIKEKQGEEKSLSREVAILESQINKTQLELGQTALAIRATELSMETNNIKIAEFSDKIEREKLVIAEIMRAIYEEDARDVVELIMSAGDLSDFFEYQKYLDNIQISLHGSLVNIKQSKQNIEQKQQELEDERESQYKLKTLQQAQKADVSSRRSQKGGLLNLTRDQKREFERALSRKERDIDQIRSQLFLLEGIGISMPLHKAYEIAQSASNVTGVRPAFLLAVLKQESSWGKNVGQCFLVDPATGAGKGKNTGNIYPRTMKPTRDVQPFLQITQELGRDPYNTLVSCPHPNYGYGGAMGPAQFIPSTWMGYKDRLTTLLGHTPDPWDLTDAFTASAFKLANGGANAQTHSAEWKAAMVYYAGSRWNKPVYSFYGDSVMELAAAIQQEITAMGG